ncbi:MAG: hypothetical protein H6Q55_436 [Deltaproteobacteria bacterium]|jgi:putative NADH-flavin reductase|nr:hypothetical protein [Deltaproteobacteria bacterium]
MTICVIDGQGGKIGSVIIAKLKERLRERVEIIALGTNSLATQTMMKARANRGASGENAIVTTLKKADVIIGTINILMANSMLGEFTPRMAQAVGESDAAKYILPITQSTLFVIGAAELSIPQMIDRLVEEVEKGIESCAR